MSFIRRYSEVINGSVTFIGNSLTLTKKAYEYMSGILGSGGTFTSLDQSLVVGDYPAGTTLDYTLNGSSAKLKLPSNSKVKYAELLWGGLYKGKTGNVSSLIDNAVKFTTPKGTHTITADIITDGNYAVDTGLGWSYKIYNRSTDVTSLVQKNGTYSLEQIPALILKDENNALSTCHAGWTLAVVYENDNLKQSNVTLWTGGYIVSSRLPPIDFTLTGFQAPQKLPIAAKLHLSAQEGDAVIDGDCAYIGIDKDNLTKLSGPNNPKNNFFASQINDDDGNLCTTGTFGDRNADAKTAVNTLACRYGWDITAIDVSKKMVPNQESIDVQLLSSGDAYLANAVAVEIEIKCANIVATKEANKTSATVGDTIDYSITLTNSGEIKANSIIVSDTLSNSLQLVDNSITIDGEAYTGTFPILLTALEPQQTTTIAFQTIVNNMPDNEAITNAASIVYTYTMSSGEKIIKTATTNDVETFIYMLNVSHTKAVDKGYANSQDTLTYSAVITNNGSIASNVTFVDAMPDGVQFLTGSVTVDGISKPEFNPDEGFSLGQLEVNQSVTVSFKAVID